MAHACQNTRILRRAMSEAGADLDAVIADFEHALQFGDAHAAIEKHMDKLREARLRIAVADDAEKAA